MAKRDVIAGIVVLLFGIFAGIMSLGYVYQTELGPGPGFIPLWLSVLLVFLSILLIINSLIKNRQGSPEVDSEHKMFINPRVLFSCLGVLIVVATIFEKIGFIISLSLAIAFYAKIIRPADHWKKVFVFGVVSSIIIYLVFNYGLGINLPKGVLPI